MFKWIEGYNGLYKISNRGTVISTPGDGKPKKALKHEILKRGYRRVTLSKNGKTKRYAVHRLVAKAFLNNPDKKPQVNHIDNNPSNNYVKNLEWCTASENIRHAENQRRMFIREANKIQKEQYLKKSREKFKEYFGNRYIDYIKKDNNKWYILYKCLLCGCNVTTRSDQIKKSTECCKQCSYKIRRKKYGK